jgi:hypothetical protein
VRDGRTEEQAIASFQRFTLAALRRHDRELDGSLQDGHELEVVMSAKPSLAFRHRHDLSQERLDLTSDELVRERPEAIVMYFSPSIAPHQLGDSGRLCADLSFTCHLIWDPTIRREEGPQRHSERSGDEGRLLDCRHQQTIFNLREPSRRKSAFRCELPQREAGSAALIAQAAAECQLFVPE